MAITISANSISFTPSSSSISSTDAGFSFDGTIEAIGSRTLIVGGAPNAIGQTAGYQSAGARRDAARSGSVINDTAISKFLFSNDTSISDVATMAAGSPSARGTSSSTHGYITAGPAKSIQKFQFSNDGNAVTVGDDRPSADVSPVVPSLPSPTTIPAPNVFGLNSSFQSQENGYGFKGGINFAPIPMIPSYGALFKFPFSADNPATFLGLFGYSSRGGSTGVTGPTFGGSVGGNTAPPQNQGQNQLDTISYSSDAFTAQGSISSPTLNYLAYNAQDHAFQGEDAFFLYGNGAQITTPPQNMNGGMAKVPFSNFVGQQVLGPANGIGSIRSRQCAATSSSAGNGYLLGGYRTPQNLDDVYSRFSLVNYLTNGIIGDLAQFESNKTGHQV